MKQLSVRTTFAKGVCNFEAKKRMSPKNKALSKPYHDGGGIAMKIKCSLGSLAAMMAATKCETKK
jgi:hypothetical protein